MTDSPDPATHPRAAAKRWVEDQRDALAIEVRDALAGEVRDALAIEVRGGEVVEERGGEVVKERNPVTGKVREVLILAGPSTGPSKVTCEQLAAWAKRDRDLTTLAQLLDHAPRDPGGPPSGP